MAKVISLPVPHSGKLAIPLDGGALLQVVPFRESPRVALTLSGPRGGNAGGVVLHFDSARVLGTWLQRLVADSEEAAAAPPARQGPAAARRQRPALAPDASSVLAAGLDAETVLPAFARLAVPSFADWWSIDLIDGDFLGGAGSIRRLVVAHADPTKIIAAARLKDYPPDPHAPHPRSDVLRTGTPEIARQISDDRIVSAARDAEHVAILRSLGCRSSITVPLMSRKQVLGVMTFVTAESGRRYRADDLPSALAFAHCAALTLENARLFRKARRVLKDGTPPRRPRAPTPG
jgi:GAF domain-containing protein